MLLRVGCRKRGLADTAQPVQRRDGDAALVARERRLDLREIAVAPHEMLRHPDRDVGDREDLAGKRDGRGRGGLGHEFAEPEAGRILGYSEEMAATHVIAERG